MEHCHENIISAAISRRADSDRALNQAHDSSVVGSGNHDHTQSCENSEDNTQAHSTLNMALSLLNSISQHQPRQSQNERSEQVSLKNENFMHGINTEQEGSMRDDGNAPHFEMNMKPELDFSVPLTPVTPAGTVTPPFSPHLSSSSPETAVPMDDLQLTESKTNHHDSANMSISLKTRKRKLSETSHPTRQISTTSNECGTHSSQNGSREEGVKQQKIQLDSEAQYHVGAGTSGAQGSREGLEVENNRDDDDENVSSGSSGTDGVRASRGMSGEKHVCREPGCTMVFERRYNLKVHMRKHTGQTPYTCMVNGCAKKFKWRSSMAHHIKSHARKGHIRHRPPIIQDKNIAAHNRRLGLPPGTALTLPVMPAASTAANGSSPTTNQAVQNRSAGLKTQRSRSNCARPGKSTDGPCSSLGATSHILANPLMVAETLPRKILGGFPGSESNLSRRIPDANDMKANLVSSGIRKEGTTATSTLTARRNEIGRQSAVVIGECINMAGETSQAPYSASSTASNHHGNRASYHDASRTVSVSACEQQVRPDGEVPSVSPSAMFSSALAEMASSGILGSQGVIPDAQNILNALLQEQVDHGTTHLKTPEVCPSFKSRSGEDQKEGEVSRATVCRDNEPNFKDLEHCGQSYAVLGRHNKGDAMSCDDNGNSVDVDDVPVIGPFNPNEELVEVSALDIWNGAIDAETSVDIGKASIF